MRLELKRATKPQRKKAPRESPGEDGHHRAATSAAETISSNDLVVRASRNDQTNLLLIHVKTPRRPTSFTS